MRNLWAIYRREMGHYFVSPIAYVVGAVFLVVSGYFFNGILAFYIQRSMEALMESARFGGPSQMDVPGLVIRSFFEILGSLVLFIMPILSMGVYAEEKKRGTIELLMTSPLSDAQIVLGKFFASLSLFVILLLPTAAYQIFLFHYSDPQPPWRIILVGYLGIVLLGSVLMGLGSLISSLTENQIVAAVVIFGVSLILWVLDLSVRDSTSAVGAVLRHVSVVRHYDDFTMGVIDLASVIFFVTFTIFTVFLTLRSLDSMRWRRA
jgi:ABC-2 type transport system permease protein